jgi:hypothetical protein
MSDEDFKNMIVNITLRSLWGKMKFIWKKVTKKLQGFYKSEKKRVLPLYREFFLLNPYPLVNSHIGDDGGVEW